MPDSGYTIDLKNYQEILAKMAQQAKFDPLKKLLNKAALLGQRTARENAPRDTAALQRDIQIEMQPFSSRVFTTLTYAPVMEFGRRPGAKMPPPGVLQGWMRRHGFLGSEFVLARAIAKRGIKGRFFMKAAKDKVEAELPNMLDDMKAEVEAQWGGGGS